VYLFALSFSVFFTLGSSKPGEAWFREVSSFKNFAQTTQCDDS